MRLNFLLAFSIITFAGISNALACTSPAGVAGEMGYDITGTDKYQYCDGTNWVDMSEIVGPTAGLIGYWDLDEKSGTFIKDLSGNGNHGTWDEGASGDDNVANDKIAGQINTGLVFDYTKDYISTNLSAGGLPAKTYAGWFYWTADNQWQTMLLEGDSFNSAQYVGLSTASLSDNQIYLYQSYNGGASNNYCSSGLFPTLNKWYHIVGTIDKANNEMKIYADGELIKTCTPTLSSQTFYDPVTYGVQMSSKGDGGGDLGGIFWGYMDDLRVYNRALSGAEVSDLYNATHGGLVGHWKLDETSGTLASDSSSFGNNGTMLGGLAGTDTTTGQINNAIAHNGTSDYIEIPNDSSLNFVDFTTAGWFKTLAATGQSSQIIITKSVPNAGGGLNQRDFSMGVNEPEMSFRCGYRPGPTGGSFYATPETVNAITPGVWYHGACVYNSTTNTYTSYINGIQHSQLDTTANPPTSPATTGLTRIAGDTYVVGAGSEDFFNGDLDDIRLYNRALSASEIYGLFSCTQEGKLDYNTIGNVFQWCGNNYTSYDVTNSPGAGGGSCAASGSKIAGSAGAMQYDTANNKMVYCGGGPNWIDIPN